MDSFASIFEDEALVERAIRIVYQSLEKCVDAAVVNEEQLLMRDLCNKASPKFISIGSPMQLQRCLEMQVQSYINHVNQRPSNTRSEDTRSEALQHASDLLISKGADHPEELPSTREEKQKRSTSSSSVNSIKSNASGNVVVDRASAFTFGDLVIRHGKKDSQKTNKRRMKPMLLSNTGSTDTQKPRSTPIPSPTPPSIKPRSNLPDSQPSDFPFSSSLPVTPSITNAVQLSSNATSDSACVPTTTITNSTSTTSTTSTTTAAATTTTTTSTTSTTTTAS